MEKAARRAARCGSGMLPPLPAAGAGEGAHRDGVIGQPTGVRLKTVVGQTDSASRSACARKATAGGWTASPGGHLFDDMVHKYATALWLFDQDIVSVQAVVRRRDFFFEPAAAIFEYEDPGLVGMMDVHYAPEMWLRSDYYGADEFFEIQGDEGMLWVTRATGRMLDLAPGHPLPRPGQRHRGHGVRRRRRRLGHRFRSLVGPLRRLAAGRHPGDDDGNAGGQGAPALLRRLRGLRPSPAGRPAVDHRLDHPGRLATVTTIADTVAQW